MTQTMARKENLTRPALTPLLPAAPMLSRASSPGLNQNRDFSTALISAVNTVFDSTPSGEKLITLLTLPDSNNVNTKIGRAITT